MRARYKHSLLHNSRCAYTKHMSMQACVHALALICVCVTRQTLNACDGEGGEGVCLFKFRKWKSIDSEVAKWELYKSWELLVESFPIFGEDCDWNKVRGREVVGWGGGRRRNFVSERDLMCNPPSHPAPFFTVSLCCHKLSE